jgi:hypothetical protein
MIYNVNNGNKKTSPAISNGGGKLKGFPRISPRTFALGDKEKQHSLLSVYPCFLKKSTPWPNKNPPMFWAGFCVCDNPILIGTF